MRKLASLLAAGAFVSVMASTPAHADVITDGHNGILSGNVITVPVTVLVPIKDVAVAVLGQAWS